MEKVGKFTVEEYNDGHSSGLAIYKNGYMIVLIDEPIEDMVSNVYVYDDKEKDEFSHKVELKNY